MTGPPGVVEGPAERDVQELAELVRGVLAGVGGLHPAVADDALLEKVPGMAEPWIIGPAEELTVCVVTTSADLPARPRLVRARALLQDLLGVAVRLVLVDVVRRPPDGSVDEALGPPSR